MRLVPFIMSWGLFSGPRIQFFLVPDGKPMPKDEEEHNRHAAARQEEEYRAMIKRGGPDFSGLAAPSRCQCHNAYKQP
jgi:hypothetical protein